MNEDNHDKKQTIHRWTMLDGYTYFTYEESFCDSCKCNPCDCDWGTNEDSDEDTEE